MKKDEMYLENLDEFINDENRIVTYKWLSRTLCVHCNIAKQMLYKFTQNEEKKKSGLTVTYFVSGVTKPDENGSQVVKCSVIPEEKLEGCKKSLAALTSCHVYSIQKTQLMDSNALFMADYEKLMESIYDSKKYSSIQNERAVLRSQEDMELLTFNSVPAVEPDKKPATGTTVTSKPAGKKQPQSAIASMFSKADSSKKSGKDDVKIKEEPTKEAPLKGQEKGGKAKAGGMMANFFTKQTGNKPDTGPKSAQAKETKLQKKSSPDKKSMPEKKPSSDKKSVPDKKPSPDKKSVPDKKPLPVSKSKKTPRLQDSDDEEIQTKSKRRRIKPDLFDSSSEEEDMEEDEEPIPPTPPQREPSPEPEPAREDSPKVEIVKEEKTKKTSPGKESGKGGNSGQRKRKRIKKQVQKTYMDKEGFMVTEKVLEDHSTDASEGEEPVKKAAKEAPKHTQAKGKKSPQKKVSPGKKGGVGGGGGKQTSLMSFFKKS